MQQLCLVIEQRVSFPSSAEEKELSPGRTRTPSESVPGLWDLDDSIAADLEPLNAWGTPDLDGRARILFPDRLREFRILKRPRPEYKGGSSSVSLLLKFLHIQWVHNSCGLKSRE